MSINTEFSHFFYAVYLLSCAFPDSVVSFLFLLSISVQPTARFLSNIPTKQVSLFCLSVDPLFIIGSIDTILPRYQHAIFPCQSESIKLSTTNNPSVSLHLFNQLSRLFFPKGMSAERLIGS